MSIYYVKVHVFFSLPVKQFSIFDDSSCIQGCTKVHLIKCGFEEEYEATPAISNLTSPSVGRSD